jgi:iron complex outermembrane receptor protein
MAIGRWLALGASSLAWCVPAVAQDAAAPPATSPAAAPEASAVTTPEATAAAPQAQDTGIGDIIVTATKRSQNLQDVSASVTALGSERLQTSRVATVEDLQVLVPTVSFGQDFNMAKIFIRGIGQNTSTAGSEPAVSLHIDGAVIARPEAQLTGLFDLERVEVLRGPQGTLYGRNSTGGSINLITAKPTADFSGYANASYGNYDLFEVEGAISGPITDKIRARLAFKTQDRDGYGRNPVTGNDVDGANRQMARLHVQLDPTEKLNILLTGEYYRQDDSSGAVHYRSPSFPTIARLAPLGIGGYATNPRDTASEVDVGVNTKNYAFTATIGLELSDNLTLTSLTNYRSFKTVVTQDLDVSSVVESLATNGQPSTIQHRFTRSKQWSDEVRLNYDTDYVNVVAGAFYFNEQQNPADNLGISVQGGEQSYLTVLRNAGFNLDEAYRLCQQDGQPGTENGTLAPKRLCGDTHLGTSAFAGFGRAQIGLGMLSPSLESLSLKLGGRYSRETRDSANPSYILAAGGRGPVIRTTREGTYRKRKFKDFTPEAGIEWKPNRDILVYYTYSEGFKAGSGENALGSTVIVDPETVKNHEVGIKATLLDRRLAINLAGYSYKLKDLQINKTISGGAAGFTTIFENAAKTSAKGIELEVFARPVDMLRLSGSVGYTDAQFDDFLTLDPLNPVNVAAGNPYNPLLPSGALRNPALPRNDDRTAFGGPCGASATTDLAPCNINLAGNPTRNTPKWTWNVHGDLDLPFAPAGGSLVLAGDVSYKGKTYFTEFARLIEGSRAYTLANATLTFRSADERFSLSGWVKNLTDVFRPSSTFALATGRIIGVTYIPPRTYGATAGFRF